MTGISESNLGPARKGIAETGNQVEAYLQTAGASKHGPQVEYRSALRRGEKNVTL